MYKQNGIFFACLCGRQSSICYDYNDNRYIYETAADVDMFLHKERI